MNFKKTVTVNNNSPFSAIIINKNFYIIAGVFMKKIFLSLSFLIFAVFTPLFAEQGVLFDVGADVSFILKPYLYEQVGYFYKWNSGWFVGADVRVMENITKQGTESAIYFMGGPTFGYKNWYFTGGPLFYTNMESIKDTSTSFLK